MHGVDDCLYLQTLCIGLVLCWSVPEIGEDGVRLRMSCLKSLGGHCVHL